MRALLTALFCLFLLPFTALAQDAERPNTILVLDGSGSMWGQIDGVNKIVIAREVIAEMLADMRDDQALGLTVYGHRERGSCSDIETIVDPAVGTRAAILEAVNSINPRGRTPMTDAVVAAAQSLRHTENAATVILVSDGIENCNPDPCAIAAELEASGVGFTAHVVGFDVASEPEARAQMQCIAENTGGLFLTADNASELAAALDQVVMAPSPVTTLLQARVMPGDTPPTRPVSWSILGADGSVVSSGVNGTDISTALLPGDYVARATRTEPEGAQSYQTAFSVVDAGQTPVVVAMPEIVETVPVSFTARVAPDMTVPASPLIWTLYDGSGTTLLGPVEAPGGNVALLPGNYRLQVERVNEGNARYERSFTVPAGQPQEVIIPLPALLVDITFSARLDSADGPIITDPILWEVTPLEEAPDAANPTTLGLTRGAYTVTAYWTVAETEQSADFVVVDQPREIVLIFDTPLPQATVTAPATAVAGSTIEVGWTGPDNRNDYIGIGAVGADGSARWENFTYTRDGSPLDLLVPVTPGAYVIAYFLDDGRVPIGETQITVTEVTATLTAPASATAGSTVEVGWTGPDYRNDYIGIGPVDAEGSAQWTNFAYTRDGAPADLLIPTEPGDYVIQYFLDQDRVSIASVPISVTEVSASVTAPATAVAGSTIEVGWTGPDNRNDYIGIGLAGADGSAQWENFSYTRDGSPADLLIPTTPGDYVIQYFLDQDRVSIASTTITVTEVQATVTAPATAVVGSSIEVSWTGPDNRNDYIGIGPAGADGSRQWSNFTYTRDGSPLDLMMPTERGDYVIQYFLDQDRVSLVSVPITLTEVTATLTAPAMAVAGDTVEIGWTGPDYRNDYIGIGPAGADGSAQWSNFTYTRDGSPADLLMPPMPGPYVIQYFLDQDRVAIASVPITIAPVEASLTAPATAKAGETIEVGWTGPDYRNDYVGIGRAGAERSAQWEAFAYTARGNPAEITLPDTPGDYVIRYFLDQDRVAIAELPITVE